MKRQISVNMHAKLLSIPACSSIVSLQSLIHTMLVSQIVSSWVTVIRLYTVIIIDLVYVVMSMQIESNPVSPIQPVGSDTSISVYVQLSMHLNISVMVHTIWSGPNGLLTERAAATLISRENITTTSPTYTSMITIKNFQLTHSGLYSCTATVLFSFSRFSDGNSYTVRARITVGKPFFFLNRGWDYNNHQLEPCTTHLILGNCYPPLVKFDSTQNSTHAVA